MNPISHFLAGYLIGRALDLRKEKLFLITLTSIISDFDVPFFYLITGFQNPSYFHAGITHTFLFGLIASILLSTIIFLFMRKNDDTIKANQLLYLIGCAFLGIILHFSMDLITTTNEYAIFHHVYFWPLWNFSFHLEYIFLSLNDPIIWILQLGINFLIIGFFLRDYFIMEKRPWNLFIKMDENAKISVLDKVLVILILIFYIYWQTSLILKIFGGETFDIVAFFVGIFT